MLFLTSSRKITLKQIKLIHKPVRTNMTVLFFHSKQKNRFDFLSIESLELACKNKAQNPVMGSSWTEDELQQSLTPECVSGSGVQRRHQHLLWCEEASVINSPLCAASLSGQNLMLIISPAAFVHFLQTKPVESIGCCSHSVHPAQRENSQCYRPAGVISENMHHDNTSQVLHKQWVEIFLFFTLLSCRLS